MFTLLHREHYVPVTTTLYKVLYTAAERGGCLFWPRSYPMACSLVLIVAGELLDNPVCVCLPTVFNKG